MREGESRDGNHRRFRRWKQRGGSLTQYTVVGRAGEVGAETVFKLMNDQKRLYCQEKGNDNRSQTRQGARSHGVQGRVLRCHRLQLKSPDNR